MMSQIAYSTDPQAVFRSLLCDQSRPPNYRRTIDVSFRGVGGAVGRRDFATHWIHWYPAKMFHRIPSVFLDTIKLPPPARILDPFCGSGTVLLEANIRGHNAIGIDVNPLARLISKVKTTSLDSDELERQLSDLLARTMLSRSMPNPEPILDSWISLAARTGLHRLSTAISQIADEDCRNFFVVTLTSIVRQASQADPAIPPLVRLREDRAEAAGTRYQNALTKSRRMTTSTVYSEFTHAAHLNIRRMSELNGLGHQLGRTTIAPCGSDAANTQLMPRSVDAVITSPPYCGSQKYVRSLKLELIISGSTQDEVRQIDRQTLGTEAISTAVTPITELMTGDAYVDCVIHDVYRKNPVRARIASEYTKYLFSFANECHRVVKPGGHVLVTLGRSTLAGISFKADHVFSKASQAAGMELVATLVDPIPSRGLLTKRHASAGRIDHEYIVWLQHPR